MWTLYAMRSDIYIRDIYAINIYPILYKEYGAHYDINNGLKFQIELCFFDFF
jgi:hypothetical protein